MNKKMLQRLVGKRIMLEPPAHMEAEGRRVPVPEPLWEVLPSPRAGDGVEIRHPRGYTIDLPHDHVREYMTDPSGMSAGILVLKRHLVLTDRGVRSEPIRAPAAVPPAPGFNGSQVWGRPGTDWGAVVVGIFGTAALLALVAPRGK